MAVSRLLLCLTAPLGDSCYWLYGAQMGIQNGPNMGPARAQYGPHNGPALGAYIGPDGPKYRPPHGPNLGPLSWPTFDPDGAQIGPIWDLYAPKWPIIGITHGGALLYVATIEQTNNSHLSLSVSLSLSLSVCIYIYIQLIPLNQN
jgi:hypothetical protein